MTVTTKRGDRTMKMTSWSVGKKKSFVKITYPKKDNGITFLKLANNMWQYVPRIERIIKIPSSMMLQSWMGSDFTNDDLVKESSISEDYNAKLLKEDDINYTLQLLPKEDAAVVWGRIEMNVSKKRFLPVEVTYFDEDDVAIRTLYYKKVVKIDKKYYPTLWIMKPLEEDKKGRKTVIKVLSAQFDKKIKDSYFTKRALKRY